MKSLIAIQSELKAPKNQKNKFGGYMYRSAEDILEAVKPLCVKHGCLLTLSDSVELIGERFYVKATVTLIDTENGEKVEVTAYAREEDSKKGMDGSQITGTASSYARKYALNGMFCIDDTKDADTSEYKKQLKTAPDYKEPAKAQPVKKNAKDDKIIGPKEVDYIAGLCLEAGSDAHKICEYYKVSNFGEMTHSMFSSACNMLKRKKANK